MHPDIKETVAIVQQLSLIPKQLLDRQESPKNSTARLPSPSSIEKKQLFLETRAIKLYICHCGNK